MSCTFGVFVVLLKKARHFTGMRTHMEWKIHRHFGQCKILLPCTILCLQDTSVEFGIFCYVLIFNIINIYTLLIRVTTCSLFHDAKLASISLHLLGRFSFEIVVPIQFYQLTILGVTTSYTFTLKVSHFQLETNLLNKLS